MDCSRIFVSYSHRGRGPEWKAALLRALHVFEQHHLLDVWQDGKIRVSSYWEDDIAEAMTSARLAVVLLTPEALESEFILNREFPRLRDRQQSDALPVFPVVCEPCDWKSHGWLRATQAPNGSSPVSQLCDGARERVFRQLATDIAEEVSRVALAQLPKPGQTPSADRVYLDRFPISQASGQREGMLIGREQELALLDLAFAQPGTSIVSLVAWGGVGKSMLVQHWLRRLEREGWLGTQRVYAWSFHSQGTTEDRQTPEDTFLAHALEWFGVECEPTLSAWSKGRLLAEAVSRERALLILDGVEPLQYPPGPMGGQLRAPGVQSLLEHLARRTGADEPGGLCVATTREPLTDLADAQRHPHAAWGSVLRVYLGNLVEEAGAALLHHVGVSRAGAAEIGSGDGELLAASREVDGHALTLNLLGLFLAVGHGGDIRRRDLVRFESADRMVQGGTTFRMLATFEDWFADEGEIEARSLAVLRILGLFDRPADAGCMGALRRPPVIAGLTEPLFAPGRYPGTGPVPEKPLSDKAWNAATHFLASFGLVVIQADRDNQRCLLDCHPLIREYFAKRLLETSAESWRTAHRRLYEHLGSTTEQQPSTVEGLEPLYQAVAHGCHAGLHEDALMDLYFARILRGTNRMYSVRTLNAYTSDLMAISRFFNEPWARVEPSLPDLAQGWLLNQAGFDLRALGRLEESRQALRQGLESYSEHQNWEYAAATAGNLCELEQALGMLPEAVCDAERSVTLADRSGNGEQMITKRATHGEALHQSGQYAEALGLFQQAEEIQSRYQPEYPRLYSMQGIKYCDLLLAIPERLAWQRLTGLEERGCALDPWVVAAATSGIGLSGFSDDSGFRDYCRWIGGRLEWAMRIAVAGRQSTLYLALHRLTLVRAIFYCMVIYEAPRQVPHRALPSIASDLSIAVDELRLAGQVQEIPRGLLARSAVHSVKGDLDSARADLDEAWDLARRGPMRLHMADIHLHRARLFSQEASYPWESPQADLAAAGKLIEECGYHRRDKELADAKLAILGE